MTDRPLVNRHSAFHVGSCVGAHLQLLDPADVEHRGVEGGAGDRRKRRPQLPLRARRASVCRRGSRVLTRGRKVRGHVERCVAGVETQRVPRRPLARYFQTSSRCLELVADLRGDEDQRRRDEPDDGSRRFLSAQMVIAASEPRDVNCSFREADVISMFIRSSIDISVRFGTELCAKPGDGTAARPNSTKNRSGVTSVMGSRGHVVCSGSWPPGKVDRCASRNERRGHDRALPRELGVRPIEEVLSHDRDGQSLC